MTAAIVETRINYRLPQIIEQHLKHLPKGTELYFFTTETSFLHYEKYVKANYIIIEDIHNLSQYNKLMTSAVFWGYLPSGHCLIFQADSMMLRPIPQLFFQYDYIGAPWQFQQHGGNGGLSLRKVEVMAEIVETHAYTPSLGYEDVYFSNIMFKEGIGKLAPRNICSEFACETIFQLGTVGYHAIEKHLTPQQVHQIKTQYD